MVEAQLSAIWDFYPTVQHIAEPLVDTIYCCILLHVQNLLIRQCFLLYIDLEHWKWNRVTDFGLLPHPIAGQPGIFRLIPSLARKTHHSTVSWRPVGWHPAMNTRACFCSNIKKIKTHFRLDSNQHLRIISSAFYHWTTCPWRTQSRLQLVSFYGAGYRSRTGDFSMARRRVAATPNPQ